MNNFNNTFDYYINLYSDIPDEYKIFGNFGEGVWDKMVTEGLVTSYPREKVVKFLKGFIHQLFEIEVVPYMLDTDTIDIYVSSKTNQSLDLKSVKSILDSKLKVYGYFVGKISRTDHFGRTKFLIEAKFPKILTPEEIHDSPFYHITSKVYLDKIMKIGLTPREPTTIFTHPGNRIYLIQTHSKELLEHLKSLLSTAKMDKSSKDPNVKNIYKWSEDEMVILQINPEGLTLYQDPMFDISDKYNAVFTQQNISPDRITLIKTEL